MKRTSFDVRRPLYISLQSPIIAAKGPPPPPANHHTRTPSYSPLRRLRLTARHRGPAHVLLPSSGRSHIIRNYDKLHACVLYVCVICSKFACWSKLPVADGLLWWRKPQSQGRLDDACRGRVPADFLPCASSIAVTRHGKPRGSNGGRRWRCCRF